MRRSSKTFPWAAAIVTALTLAACGGTSSPPKPNDAALDRGLLTDGELAAGMNPQPAPVARSAANWIAQGDLSGPGGQAETARLKHLGFVAGISEQVSTLHNGNRYGLTLVEQFSSAKGPAAELARTVTTNGPWTLFTIPGVPGARGFEQDGSRGGRNIAFGHGDYFYVIGSGWQNGASNAVPRAQMIAIAQRLYHRVAG